MKMARLALVLCLFVAGAAGAAVAWRLVAGADGPPLEGEMRKFAPLETPRSVPDEGFTDLQGQPVRLADFRGRLVLVNLWATWCGPCVEEMPSLDRLQGKLGGKDFTVLLLSSDRGGARVVEPFLEKLGVAALSSYLDPRSVVTRGFGARGLPTSILIGRDGRELGRLEGAARWDAPAALALLRHYLAPPRPVEDGIVRTSG